MAPAGPKVDACPAEECAPAPDILPRTMCTRVLVYNVKRKYPQRTLHPQTTDSDRADRASGGVSLSAAARRRLGGV